MITRATFLIVLVAGAFAAAANEAEPAGKYIAVLKSDATLFEKVRACQELARIGAVEAVPAVAPFLGDERLGAYARNVLERTADPSAGEALRNALGAVKGMPLVGIVNSLGARSDEKAVPALAKLAGDPASGASVVALVALGRIATPAALEVLARALASGPAELRPAAAEGCVLAAERQLAQGARDGALGLYDAVRRTDVPLQLRLTATRGAILARGADGVPLLLESLRANGAAFRGMALRTLREVEGAGVTGAVASALGTMAPAVQALVIPALADRGDSAAAGAIEAAARSEAPAVRVAALEALGRCGGSSSVPILLAAVLDGRSEAEREIALAGLGRLKAPDADAAILKALPGAESTLRVKLIAVLGVLGTPKAFDALIASARDADAGVREAAVRALGQWQGEDAGAALLALAKESKDDNDAYRALGALAGLVQRLGCPNERKLAFAREALVLAQRDEEKRLIIEALGGVLAVETFALLGECFGTPSLCESACAASVVLGERLVRTAPEAVAAAMEKVRTATKTQAVADRAANVIRRAGEVGGARAKTK